MSAFGITRPCGTTDPDHFADVEYYGAVGIWIGEVLTDDRHNAGASFAGALGDELLEPIREGGQA